MGTKFTDGEWVVKQNPEFPTLHQIWSEQREGGFPVYIAKTCYAIQSEANAKLIASAPDMYNALESIINYWNTPQKATLSMENHFEHIIEIAEKALKKAK